MIPRRQPATLLLSLLLSLFAAAPAPAAPQWVATWTASPDGAGPVLAPLAIRQIIRTSVGGDAVRVVLSNEYGSTPLLIGAAHVAARASGADVAPGSSHALTFGGAATITLQQGARAVSDPVAMKVAPLSELAVTLWLPAGSAAPTVHGAGLQTAYLATGADATGAAVFPTERTDDSRYFLAGVEVRAGEDARAVAVLGDSIVDGIGATGDRYARWPDVLAQRLHAARQPVAVLNAGIAGNRLLRDGTKPFVGPSATRRFERDVLRQPGVDWVVIAHGINDITAGDMLADPAERASAAQIIDGLRALIRRAHGNGVKVCGTTLLPLGGVRKPFVHSTAGEAARQAVNGWIRDGGEFDAVADLDLLLRDPAQPGRLRGAFDSGDHLHPNDAGYEAIGAAVGKACGFERFAQVMER